MNNWNLFRLSPRGDIRFEGDESRDETETRPCDWSKGGYTRRLFKLARGPLRSLLCPQINFLCSAENCCQFARVTLVERIVSEPSSFFLPHDGKARA